MDGLGQSLQPLAGGWSGQTFLAEAAGERTVVRIYATPSHRGAAAHEVDAALLRLMRGLVPVPDVLEVRRADEAAGTPALLVTSFLPGERGDLLLPGLDADRLALLGRHLGRLLVRLAGMPFLQAGSFVDEHLAVAPYPDDADDLLFWVDQHEPDLPWTPDELDGLRQVARDAQALLDGVRRTCLVHSDFNPKNLLIDPDTLVVTGLLDWEFAHAGNPFTDLGNLLRFDRVPAFADAVLDIYAKEFDLDPADCLDLARSADLLALIDLASRRAANPVAERAHDLLRTVARQRDVHAMPS